MGDNQLIKILGWLVAGIVVISIVLEFGNVGTALENGLSGIASTLSGIWPFNIGSSGSNGAVSTNGNMSPWTLLAVVPFALLFFVLL